MGNGIYVRYSYCKNISRISVFLWGYVLIWYSRRGGRSSDEKIPVNQRFPPTRGGNGCVFLFPKNRYEGIDLPRGIGCGEQVIYILAKGYAFAKLEKRVALHFL